MRYVSQASRIFNMENYLNKKFPLSCSILTLIYCRAISYKYNQEEKDSQKRLFIPPNPCEILLLSEYPNLKKIWNDFKNKLNPAFNNFLELDARYCIGLFEQNKDWKIVSNYLADQLNIFNK